MVVLLQSSMDGNTLLRGNTEYSAAECRCSCVINLSPPSIYSVDYLPTADNGLVPQHVRDKPQLIDTIILAFGAVLRREALFQGPVLLIVFKPNACLIYSQCSGTDSTPPPGVAIRSHLQPPGRVNLHRRMLPSCSNTMPPRGHFLADPGKEYCPLSVQSQGTHY